MYFAWLVIQACPRGKTAVDESLLVHCTGLFTTKISSNPFCRSDNLDVFRQEKLRQAFDSSRLTTKGYFKFCPLQRQPGRVPPERL